MTPALITASTLRRAFLRSSQRRSFSAIPLNLNLKEDGAASQTLRGCGQVIFLGNASQGAAVLAGLAIGDPTLAAFALGGGAWCTALARSTLKEGDEATNNGLHAYNGVLVGAAFYTFLGPNPLTIAGATLVGSTGAFALTRALGATYPFGPQWTYAFNAATIGGLMTAKMLAPPVPETATDSSVAETAIELSDLIHSPLTGVSQIFLINSPLSGAALLGAIAMASPVAAAHAGAGAAIGTAVGVASGVDYATIANGLVGFNPCLTSLSVAVFFPTLSLGQVALSTGGAVGTTMVSSAMGPLVMETFGTPAFTLPFCLVATATYGIGKSMKLK